MSTEPRGHAGVEGRVQRYVERETAVAVPEVLTVSAEGYVAAYDDAAPREEEYEDRVLKESWLRTAGRTLASLHEDATFDRPGLLAVDGDPGDPAAGLRVGAATADGSGYLSGGVHGARQRLVSRFAAHADGDRRGDTGACRVDRLYCVRAVPRGSERVR